MHVWDGEQMEATLKQGEQMEGLFIYLLNAYSLVSRTGSPQGFSQIQISHKMNTIQNMHSIYNRKQMEGALKLKVKKQGENKTNQSTNAWKTIVVNLVERQVHRSGTNSRRGERL